MGAIDAKALVPFVKLAHGSPATICTLPRFVTGGCVASWGSWNLWSVLNAEKGSTFGQQRKAQFGLNPALL